MVSEVVVEHDGLLQMQSFERSYHAHAKAEGAMLEHIEAS